MARKPITLSLDQSLISEMKIQAIREGRTVSDMTEQLYREYLDRQRKVKGRAKP